MMQITWMRDRSCLRGVEALLLQRYDDGGRAYLAMGQSRRKSGLGCCGLHPVEGLLMSLSTKLFFASLFVGLLSCVPTFVEVLLRKRYPMLRRGAVLITGASKGIGRAAVDAVVNEGFTVYAGVRKQEDYEALQALNNTRVRPVKLDIDDQASVDAAFDLISSELPGLKTPLLSGVVNNAAWGARGPVEFTDLETVRQMFETNVVGQLRVTQKFLPLLRANNGRVVFISSILGKFATPNIGVYSATKHALEAVADSLRQELLPLGVPVCLIEPGVVETPFHERAAKFDVPKEALHVYPHLFTKAKDEFRQRLLSKGAKVEEISLYILHALLSPTPLPRLACGNLDGLPASWVLWLTWMLPDRLRDMISA